MKFRNKETGEIRKAKAREDGIYLWDELTGHWWKYELDLLASSWEYYVEPKKPLIKDEKIRKAVRVWADGNNIESVHYDAFWRGFRRENSSITVWEELPLEDNEVYTIAELCGENDE